MVNLSFCRLDAPFDPFFRFFYFGSFGFVIIKNVDDIIKDIFGRIHGSKVEFFIIAVYENRVLPFGGTRFLYFAGSQCFMGQSVRCYM